MLLLCQSVGLVPKRQYQSNNHQPKQHEVDIRTRGIACPRNGQDEKDEFPAQMFQQEQRKQEGNHGSVPDQRQDAQQTDHGLAEPPNGEKRHDRLCASWRKGVQWYSVGLDRRMTTIEDRAQANAGLHENDQAEQPEREFMPTMRIVDALWKKQIEHGVLFQTGYYAIGPDE